MEDFGSINVRLYLSVPNEDRLRTKQVVLHRFHGRRSECMRAYAKLLEANQKLRGMVEATWEVREAIYYGDLPAVASPFATAID